MAFLVNEIMLEDDKEYLLQPEPNLAIPRLAGLIATVYVLPNIQITYLSKQLVTDNHFGKAGFRIRIVFKMGIKS